MVELLVVIAIIALLLSIVVPSLRKVRDQAKRTICQTHLKQWGYIYSMYTNDHNSHFPLGCLAPGVSPRGSRTWFLALQPYYQDPEILTCPSAVPAPDPKPDWDNNQWNWKFGSWRNTFSALMQDPKIAQIEGSYGQNWWITSCRGFNDGPYLDQNKFKNKTAVWSPSQVPMLGDAGAFLARPTEGAVPPPHDGDYTFINSDEMRRVCTNRHNTGGVNWVFVDGSVNEIRLKRLWQTRWHKNWVPRVITEWPEWMRSLPE